MPRIRFQLGSWFCAVLLHVVVATAGALAQEPADDSLSEDEARQVQVAERFFTVLEKSPRRGTALDRVYGHHVEFGTLDKFLTQLAAKAQQSPDDGAAWMLLGLFEAHRGEDARAVDAFRVAEKNRADDALASYYLGQSLLLIGRPDDAVAAFERAIARNPPRTDLLEIFQALGRVHQRAQRTEAALDVWQRLEALFPGDPRVQEQIAVTLVEEGQYALALPRYEQLAKLVGDDYRRVVYQIEAAELKIRQNRRDEGLQDLENVLSNLNPNSWMHRDVRRRIEEVFLRTGDQDGLVTYYEKWTAGHPEDVDAMARVAKFLASAARVPEATQWMEKALQLAPKRIELRRAFIEQLVDDQRIPEAIAQYELLAKAGPADADLLRDWGKLVLRDKSRDTEQRKAEAGKIWRQIIEARPNDAVTIAQVADLFRQANSNDEAISLYQKAVAIAPEEPQYREYLGEFYHVLKRPDEALATWRAIAEAPRRTAVNVARLAEVYNSFGYLEQAIAEIADACRLDPKDLGYELTAADYHARANKFDEALKFVEAADKLVASDDEREAVIKARIEVLQSSRRLEEETEQMAADVAANASSSAAEWHLLARYFEADRRWSDATEAIEQAVAKEATSAPALATAARIAELAGDFRRAADMSRQLARFDRRSRSDHLMNVARLESQMGRTDEALQAGKDLIASAPGNTDNYEFYAQLCFRLGKPEDGLDALRKAVRISPTEPHLTTALGSALAEQFRTDEAIEVYWRAFERTEEIDDKTSLTTKLAELYLQTNQFDKMIERFERERQADEQRREITICLAQAHHTSGDYGTARHELESLLNQESQDSNLLQQLSKLCEQGGDLDAAVDYQRRLVELAPGQETEFRLAGLLQARGDREEASEIYVRLTRREEDPARLLRSVDSLLTQGSYDSVRAITEPLLSQQRDNWELLYREIAAWASLDKSQEAKDRCQRLLSLAVPHDTLGVAAEDKFKQAQSKARSENLRGLAAQMPRRQSPLLMLGTSSQVRQAVGLDVERYYSYGGGGPQRVWTPDSFGVARMAAYGWLLKFEQDTRQSAATAPDDQGQAKSFADTIVEAAAAENADRETIYDAMYVDQLRGNYDAIFRMSRRLAKAGGKEEQRFFLSSLRTRDVNAQRRFATRSGNQAAKKDPLSNDDVELMLACFEGLAADDPENQAQSAAFGGQVTYTSTGQMYVNVGGNWVPVSGRYGGNIFLGSILEELNRAGREEKAQQLLDGMIERAQTAQELSAAMSVLFAQEKPEAAERLDQLYARWVEAAKDAIAKAPTVSSRQPAARQSTNVLATNANFLVQWMGRLAPQEEHARILAILDPALDLAIVEAKKRRAARSSRGPSSMSQQQRSGVGMSIVYGKEQNYVNIAYPQPNQYVDQSALMLLREVFEVFKRNDVSSDLPSHLRKRLERADADSLIYEQLILGYVLWWTDEQEEAVQLLTEAANQLPDDPAFRLEMAALHETLGDVDRALEIVESVAPRDHKLVQQRETLALQFAERLGDVERARQAAERLFGLRLDNNTQLALVDRMRRLGLQEMAEAVLSRVERRTGGQTASLATLMMMYQGQGKVDLAQQIAHTILRRSSASTTTAGISLRAMMRGRSPGDGSRMQALRLLQQTGALKELTARMEAQLQQSPESPRLYEQLIEYYQAAGNRDKVRELLEKAVVHRPDAAALRLQLASHLEQTGKLKEACDQYLELLQQKPALLMDDFYSVRNVFDRAQRRGDLVKALDKVNLQSLGQPYYVIDLLGELLQERSGRVNEADTEIALRLFERVFESFPAYRNQLISRIYNPKLWSNDRVYALAKRGIVPSTNEVAAEPWFGVNAIYSYSSSGTVNAMFHQLINGVRGTDKLVDLRNTIEAARQQNPNWHGGAAMLALIDLKENKKVEAKQRLEQLVADEEVFKTMPSDACWIVGQELDQFEDTRPIALRLFESAVSSDQRNRSQLQYSPVSRLVKLYGSMGRKEDARQLLQKQLRGASGDQYDAQYGAYMRVENSIWAGGQFLELGYAVDAVRIYRELIDNGDSLQQANIFYGGRNDQFANQAQNGLKKALASIKDADAEEAVKQLLVPAIDAAANQPVLDLMLSVPDAKSIRKQPLESSLGKLLHTIAQNSKVAGEIDARLSSLAQEHPQDFTAPITLALHRLQADDARAVESLKQLAELAAAQPLDEIPAGRRPNSRQRRAALTRVPVWLVARAYISQPDTEQLANQLGAHALEAARRQIDDKYFVAILFEWGKLAAEAGNRDVAEQKWSELLDAATKRPERREPAGQPPRRGVPVALPPLPASAPNGFGASAMRAPLLLQLLPEIGWFSLLASPASPAAATAVPPTAAAPAATALPAGNAAPIANAVPPLTISQFRLAMEVAVVAAENDMPELSQRAVVKAMVGGIPIPDPAKSAPGQSGAFGAAAPVMVMSGMATRGGGADGANPLEAEVAGTLRRVFAKWQGDSYQPTAVYELLHPIVLPVSRPAEISLYADSTKLRDAEATSLGATLVDWAHRADRLADLAERVAARKQQPQSLIPALVMETLIDLKQSKTDSAEAHLQELAAAVQQGALPQMVQLACHAALPATDVPELRKPAYTILQAAVRPETQPTAGNEEQSLGRLVGMVNRYLADEPDKVKQFCESFLVGRQAQYSRYGGDYGLYLQWRDWANIAEEIGKAGVPTVALDFMGRVTDYRYQNNARPSLIVALTTVCRDLRKLEPQQRYEAWRDWTMPTQGRRTVRILGEWVEPLGVPRGFLEPGRPAGPLDDAVLLSNVTELIDAADVAGRIDELRDRARQAMEQDIPGGEILLALVHVRAGDQSAAAPVVAKLLSTLPDRSKRVDNQPPPDLWGDYLVYHACMQSREFAQLYANGREALRTALRSNSQTQILVQFDQDTMRRLALDTDAQWQPGVSDLVHWLPVAVRDLTSSTQPSWLVHEGHVVHLPGSGTDTLQFAYPVTGDFQFSVDCFEAGWAEGEAGYGGIIVETGSNVVVSPLSGHESIRRERPFRRSGYSRIDIRVQSGKLQYRLNNHLAYEEDASPTSPWLMLYSHAPRTTTFRNLKLTGNPIIPREVELIHGDRMDGWISSFVGDTQPRLRFMAEKPKDENNYIYYEQQREPAEHDWRAQHGELTGRPDTDLVSFTQSWIYYHRPLRERETFRYEFFYSPGSSAAFPTVGRLAFLLEPHGVDVHWIARPGWDDSVVGVPIDNRIAESECRRGPAELPLKANDWNKVAVTLNGDRVAIQLNDVEIYERELEPENQRLFGIFRDKRHAAKVRGAVLTGPWPEQWTRDLQATLLATNVERTDADRRLVGGMLNDLFAAHDAAAIVARARELPDAERLALLRQWVLPSPDHDTIRLHYLYAPVAASFEAANSVATHDGLVCPAVDLIDTAERHQGLSELLTHVSEFAPRSKLDERNQLALQAMVNTRLGNDEAARALLSSLYEMVGNDVPKETPARERVAEFVAAWLAAERPVLRHAALNLAQKMHAMERDSETASNDTKWRRDVGTLLGRTDAALASVDGTDNGRRESELTQWAVVCERDLERVSRQRPAAAWQSMRGVAQHRPDGAESRLFFASPLRGKFEVTAQLSLDADGDAALTYGGHAAGLRPDLKTKRITALPHDTSDTLINRDVPSMGWMADVRIAVDGNKVTTFANGVQLHEDFLASPPAPWLVLQAGDVMNGCTAHNIQILGDPEIPEQIDLIATMNDAFWQTDLYGESYASDSSDENDVWLRQGEEITGQLRKNRSASPLEGLIAYQRPMLEDGTIEFEAYFVPGEFEVHPAIGRQAIVVRPLGVRLHRLTDGEWSRDELQPDNESPIEGAAKSVPLHENDWNRYRLELTGNQIVLFVNDVPVATVALTEPPAARFFGLFRYVDKTICRVRNLTYRGQWPREIPSVADQDLANPQADSDADGSKLQAETIDLVQPLADLAPLGIAVIGTAGVTPSAVGMEIRVDRPTDANVPTGLAVRRRIERDFDIVLDLDALEVTPANGESRAEFALRTAMDTADQVWVETSISLDEDGRQRLTATVSQRDLGGSQLSSSRPAIGNWKARRIRISRHRGSVQHWFAEAGSDDFRLLSSFPVGDAPITEVQVVGRAAGSIPAGDTPAIRAVVRKIELRTLPTPATAVEPAAN